MEEIDRKIELEKNTINNNRKLMDEIDQLNKNLEVCIDIVGKSVLGNKTKKVLDSLRYDNSISYKQANEKINDLINESKNKIEIFNKDKEKSSKKEEEWLMGRFVADPYTLIEKGKEIQKKAEEFRVNTTNIYNNIDEMISKDYLSPEAREIAKKIEEKRELLDEMANVIEQYGNFSMNAGNKVLKNQEDIISAV